MDLFLMFKILFLLNVVHGQAVATETKNTIIVSINTTNTTAITEGTTIEKNVDINSTTPNDVTSTATMKQKGKPPNDNCITLEGEFGKCVALTSCRYMIEMLMTRTEASLNYIQRSRCIGPVIVSICCKFEENNSSIIPYYNTPQTSKYKDRSEGGNKCCGADSNTNNKIADPQETSISHYPWLVIIEYKTGSNFCQGSVINNRYVLTAAKCIVNEENKSLEPNNIILTDYHTVNLGINCVKFDKNKTCTDGLTKIPIAEIIIHQKYRPRHFRHNIALIKLQTPLHSDFIQPIDLPTLDVTKSATKPNLIVADWTLPYMKGQTPKKHHTGLSLTTIEDCGLIYRKYNLNIEYWVRYICAGGLPNKDTCNREPGRPLMYFNGMKYELVGIMSFGLSCEVQNAPDIYTNVYEYLPWIRRHIKR